MSIYSLGLCNMALKQKEQEALFLLFLFECIIYQESTTDPQTMQ